MPIALFIFILGQPFLPVLVLICSSPPIPKVPECLSICRIFILSAPQQGRVNGLCLFVFAPAKEADRLQSADSDLLRDLNKSLRNLFAQANGEPSSAFACLLLLLFLQFFISLPHIPGSLWVPGENGINSKAKKQINKCNSLGDAARSGR